MELVYLTIRLIISLGRNCQGTMEFSGPNGVMSIRTAFIHLSILRVPVYKEYSTTALEKRKSSSTTHYTSLILSPKKKECI
jgi:hypothetical protein